jgi:hypothetical protein
VKIEWVLLAEGLTQDARGAITVVGLNQNIQVTDVLPAQTKRVILVHIGASEGEFKGDEVVDLAFRFWVRSPSGEIVSVHTIQTSSEIKSEVKISPSVDIPIQIGMALTEYGTYEIGVSVTYSSGEVEEVVVPLLVASSSNV